MDSEKKKRINTRALIQKIAMSGIFVALSFILSLLTKFIPIFHMPQGGSVSLDGLGIVYGGLLLGPIFGTVIGVLYGILNFIFDGYFIHWGSFFLDYTIAYGLMGLASGFFTKFHYKHKIWSYFVATFLAYLGRYISTSLSGALFFAEYAGGQNAFFYSFIIYNLPYIAGSMGVVMVIGAAIYYPLIKPTNLLDSQLHNN